MQTASRSIDTLRSREVERLVVGQPTSDGAGVRLTRVLTRELQRRLDPYLMLDEFRSDDPEDYLAGFPDHPHRGFETITYMIAGQMRHRDNSGGQGLLGAGGVQWMTAGRGIIHSEMPEQKDGLMHGFQLWLNLPAASKMIAPSYRDIGAAEIPEVTTPEGVRVKVIAGRALGVDGAVTRETTEPLYLDLHMPAGSTHTQALTAGHNAFLYVYAGEVEVGGERRKVGAQRLAVLGNDPGADGVAIHAVAAARLLLVSGRPLEEPIAQHGPFVMNTAQQITQAIADYQAGRF
ncbi:MAG: pirin family protein [Gammaproteobacteria bacterium]